MLPVDYTVKNLLAYDGSVEELQKDYNYTINHVGNYNLVIVRIQHEYTSLVLEMKKKSRSINTPFLDFLQQHPILYQLLQRFLRL